MWRCRCALLSSIVLVAAAPAWGQISDRQRSEALLTTGSVARPAPPRPRCRNGGDGADDNGEIVVCGPADQGQRIPSTGESAPGSRAGLRNGELHAPQLDRGSCRGKLGCFVGGGVHPPAYIIDMKAIPEAPEGSDADRIAKGEIAEP
ncbi:MAG: hypothetical protein JF595_04640 [Sphingomonadales bacterium]|nr:hypothetical protein [Sphingomonadales bacterium]